MAVEIRRVLTLTQLTHVEGGREVPEPTRMFAAMAVIRNPWFGRGFVEDMKPEIREHCPVIGKLLTEEMLRLSGGSIEGVGKASIVGMGGEVEHAQALTHSLWFGNQLREAIDAKTYLVFSNTRGAAGCTITIPMMDKDDGGRRSHYQTLQTTIPDAPAEDEIIVALGGSLGGHPLHRIGNRYEDLEEMGRSVDNPAGV
ncbi:amino acid synthesis family protein [Nioella sp.]|uniref:amino acid synthesis family protein n=1 Tax=Nioella sp. TaxID=1912091 RepID=UPI003B51E01C